ncbi:uncharacterized protein G6M90_00g093210 [Metarhizium brunneum]|uniref:Uncharacterized protein n=1 Tax=Metarhizium brunneum TaxID=500148 RepID=A0A7D5YUT2_9HYPO|nr:hypothetical protein G6M90_00g093210 [Metarhizium brunneum]
MQYHLALALATLAGASIAAPPASPEQSLATKVCPGTNPHESYPMIDVDGLGYRVSNKRCLELAGECRQDGTAEQLVECITKTIAAGGSSEARAEISCSPRADTMKAEGIKCKTDGKKADGKKARGLP